MMLCGQPFQGQLTVLSCFRFLILVSSLTDFVHRFLGALLDALDEGVLHPDLGRKCDFHSANQPLESHLATVIDTMCTCVHVHFCGALMSSLDACQTGLDKRGSSKMPVNRS